MAHPPSLAKRWDRISAGYDELVTPINTAAGRRCIARVDLGPGTRFLDVAAGTGALSLPAARTGAEVLATDSSPEMIRWLLARAEAAGLGTLDARVMDGTALDLEASTFDVVGSQHGVSIFPDMRRGLAEMVRVTKPGGQVLISAFGPLERAGFVSTFLQAVEAVAPELPVPTSQDPPLPFQVADPEVLRDRLSDAGLEDPHIEQITEQASFPSAERFWEALVHSNPIATELAGRLDQDQRGQALEIIAERLAGDPSAPGGTISTELNIGIGRKPVG